tara:strand:- start:322 stop:483 length:162 start_codon:yes stop_codon:yes gene_type:complete
LKKLVASTLVAQMVVAAMAAKQESVVAVVAKIHVVAILLTAVRRNKLFFNFFQ